MPRHGAWSKGEERPKATASSLCQRTSLLTIPLELREEIYAHLVNEASSTLLSLLLVNRRLAREVKPFLYKRPLYFDGQCELFDWLAEVDHDCLRHVTDVRFKLLDIDPETIVGALGKRLRESSVSSHSRGPETEDNPYHQACFQELKRLQKAFGLLSDVKSFTILACTTSDPQPPKPMVASYSTLLGHCFPHLQSLVSEEKFFPIDFLRNKPRLTRLRFPANSDSNGDEIARVFRRLSNLNLEICRPSSPHRVNYEWGCMVEILPHVPPLRRLLLFERLECQQPCLSEEVFVGAIEAMKRHLRTLRKLTLVADPPAGPQEAGVMRRNLFRFVEASSLHHVEVLGIYASVYRHLPGTTETFILRLDKRWTPSASFSEAMTDFLAHVTFRAVSATKDPHIPRLSKLREIQVWIADDPMRRNSDVDDDDDDDDSEEMLNSIRSKLEKTGIKFTLVVNVGIDHNMTGSEELL